jgi:hypothetical protein
MIGALAYGFLLIFTAATPWWSLLLFIIFSPWGILFEWIGVDVRLGWSVVLAVRASLMFSETPRKTVPWQAACATCAFALLWYIRLHFGTGDLPPADLDGAYKTLAYFLGGACAVYSILKLVNSAKRLSALLGATAGGLLLASSFGLLQAVTDYGDSSPSGRIAGTLGNPNFFSAYLAISATVAMVAWRLKVGSRFWQALSVVVASSTCILTFSRMGIVACCLGVGLALQMRRSGRSLNWKLILSGVAIAALAGVISGNYFTETRRNISYSSSKDLSTEQMGQLGQAINDWSRLEAAQFGLEEWTTHPVWGVGLATLAARNYIANGIYVTTHNSFIQLLSGSGLAGTTLFAVILISMSSTISASQKRFVIPVIAEFGVCCLFADFLGSIDIFVAWSVLIALLRQQHEAVPMASCSAIETEMTPGLQGAATAVSV